MALITVDNFTQTTKDNKLHDKTIAEYSIFYRNGELYFQIDTYGSNSRKHHNKVSQTIQFNKDMAKYLINILIKKFALD